MIDQELHQRLVSQMVNHIIKLRHHLLVGIQLLHVVRTDQRNQGGHSFLVLLQNQQLLIFFDQLFDTGKISGIRLIIHVSCTPSMIQGIIFQRFISGKLDPVPFHLGKSGIETHGIQIMKLLLNQILQLV